MKLRLVIWIISLVSDDSNSNFGSSAAGEEMDVYLSDRGKKKRERDSRY